jgi:hypothetical protein
MKIFKPMLVLSFTLLLATSIYVYKIKKPTYVNKEGWKRAYLATYPRSGTNWTRRLVQEATGVITGSIYPQEAELKNKTTASTPAAWGGYAPLSKDSKGLRHPEKDDPILIMTHYPITSRKEFDNEDRWCVIRIVRNPIDTIYSHSQFKYRHKPEKLPLSRHDWNKFLKKHLYEWREHIEYWDTQPNVHTYRYEDLMRDPESQLESMLSHLEISFTNEDIERACKAQPAMGTIGKHIIHFDEEDRKMVISEIGDLLDRFDYRDIVTENS